MEEDFGSALSGSLAGIVAGGMGSLLFAAMALLGAFGTVHDLVLGAWGNMSFAGPLMMVACGLPALIFGWMSTSSLRSYREWSAVQRDPVVCAAVYESSRATTRRLNRRRIHHFALRVMAPNGVPYPASASWFFPSNAQRVVTPGTSLVVLVARSDPRLVVVDWNRTEQAWAAAAASA